MLRPLKSSPLILRPSSLAALAYCVISGVLLALPYCNGHLWIFAWFSFVPLFIALEKKTKLHAFVLAYVCGLVFWAATIFWLVNVTVVGTVLLVLYLSLYFGIFGLLVTTDYRLRTIDVFVIPSAWVLLEYARSHLLSGFPWALLGYSQYRNLPVIQIADITGVWGVSFIIALVNTVLFWVASCKFQVTRVKGAVILSGVVLLVALTYGYYSLFFASFGSQQTRVRISVIQGNIPQELKWQEQSRGMIIQKYAELTRMAAGARPDLILWPEAALPVVVGEEDREYFEAAQSLVNETKIPLLLGAVTRRGGNYYNSALYLERDGSVAASYDKLHLVPFGEYIPGRKFFPILQTVVPIGDVTAGSAYTVFDKPQQFSVLICFEDLFPELSRQFVRRGARFLVNITNDAWYKLTPAPYQHLAASVFRAVENRVFLVRAANTGVSTFIAPTGATIATVADSAGRSIFVDGFATHSFPVNPAYVAVHTRTGDVFILLLSVFILYAIFRRLVRPRTP
jgi:apolipoprotein N-acyltransferase